MKGEVNGQRGLFPSNFTEPMKEKGISRVFVRCLNKRGEKRVDCGGCYGNSDCIV